MVRRGAPIRARRGRARMWVVWAAVVLVAIARAPGARADVCSELPALADAACPSECSTCSSATVNGESWPRVSQLRASAQLARVAPQSQLARMLVAGTTRGRGQELLVPAAVL